MKKNTLHLLLASCFFMLIPASVCGQDHGCTTFSLSDSSRHIFGRNLDTDSEFGYVFINKRDMNKVAYFDSSSAEMPAAWASKYGSITFNQISRDIPHGGMNEKGLVVEHMYYGSSNYEPADARPAVISHQWIQYALDNCLSVSEVIDLDTLIRISDTEYKFPIHFHLMDSAGNRAIVEFLANAFTVYQGINYSACALANSSYSFSLNYLSNFTGWGGTNPIPNNVSLSQDRFVKAADMVKNYPGSGLAPIIPYGFSILDSVWQNTKWQLVYDINNRCVHYRLLSDTTIRTICINDFDFTCTPSIEMLELGDDPSVPSNWITFSTLLNSNLINTTCSLSSFVNGILGSEKDDIAVHPENTSYCITTPVSQYELQDRTALFPNPVHDCFTVSGGDIREIRVISLGGQIMLVQSDDPKVDISRLERGIYIVEITTEKQTTKHKLVKL